MKLQQLRFLTAVIQNDLNLTAAAAKLATTQPAVSKQLKLLEGELGFRIFTRRGRAFTKMTPPGERIAAHALRVLREVQNIKRMSEELKNENRGAMAIGTTHTQARYVLPSVIKTFCEKYPEVEFHLHQGTAEQIAEMGKLGRIDFAIATGSQQLFPEHVLLPCYQWHRRIVVPRDHPRAGPRADSGATGRIPSGDVRLQFHRTLIIDRRLCTGRFESEDCAHGTGFGCREDLRAPGPGCGDRGWDGTGT